MNLTTDPARQLEKNLIQRVALGDIFRRRAANTPDAVALRDYKGMGIERLNFGDLTRALNRVASAARAQGLSKGDRVALLESGRLVQVGQAEDFRRAPASDAVRAFFEEHLGG